MVAKTRSHGSIEEEEMEMENWIEILKIQEKLEELDTLKSDVAEIKKLLFTKFSQTSMVGAETRAMDLRGERPVLLGHKEKTAGSQELEQRVGAPTTFFLESNTVIPNFPPVFPPAIRTTSQVDMRDRSGVNQEGSQQPMMTSAPLNTHGFNHGRGVPAMPPWTWQNTDHMATSQMYYHPVLNTNAYHETHFGHNGMMHQTTNSGVNVISPLGNMNWNASGNSHQYADAVLKGPKLELSLFSGDDPSGWLEQCEKIATDKEREHFFQQAFDLFDEIQEEDKEIDSAYYDTTPTKDQEVLVNDVDTGLDSFFCETFNLFDEAPKGHNARERIAASTLSCGMSSSPTPSAADITHDGEEKTWNDVVLHDDAINLYTRRHDQSHGFCLFVGCQGAHVGHKLNYGSMNWVIVGVREVVERGVCPVLAEMQSWRRGGFSPGEVMGAFHSLFQFVQKSLELVLMILQTTSSNYLKQTLAHLLLRYSSRCSAYHGITFMFMVMAHRGILETYIPYLWLHGSIARSNFIISKERVQAVVCCLKPRSRADRKIATGATRCQDKEMVAGLVGTKIVDKISKAMELIPVMTSEVPMREGIQEPREFLNLILAKLEITLEMDKKREDEAQRKREPEKELDSPFTFGVFEEDLYEL